MQYSRLSRVLPVLMAIGSALIGGRIVHGGDSPWTRLIPFKKPAASSQSVELSVEHGPWLILAASFSGSKAEQQALALIAELRNRHKFSAYLHKQSYDFTHKPSEGTMINKYGEKAKMRYSQSDKYDAIAVLVGDFRSVNDAALEKTLERIKYLKPDCLDITKQKDTSQTFAGVKDLYRRISSDPVRNKRGPMGSAFATRNPLLPDEYFTATGIDDFVMKLNRGIDYSLLENPGKFTVRVATFRGATSINQREIAEMERSEKVTDKLAVAADKAHRLTAALRKRGIDAYEFHDRTESVVTIGSFDSEGTPRPDGTIFINPKMYKIVQLYQGTPTTIPGRGMLGMQPRTLDGIAFDLQPVSMAVPRRSVAADYARRKDF